jgi:hypothetical protein
MTQILEHLKLGHLSKCSLMVALGKDLICLLFHMHWKVFVVLFGAKKNLTPFCISEWQG